MLAAEDEHFFEHPGVDYRGVIRARPERARRERQHRRRQHDHPAGDADAERVHARRLSPACNASSRSSKRSFSRSESSTSSRSRRSSSSISTRISSVKRSYGVAHGGRTYFGKDLGEPDGFGGRDSRRYPAAAGREPDREPASARRRGAAMCCAGCTRREPSTTPSTRPRSPSRSSAASGPATQLDAPYVAEMVRAGDDPALRAAAYTAGFKVTTTVDSRLQAAANRAMHSTLMAYDERHGYRGPLAHFDLPEPAAAGAHDRHAAGRRRRSPRCSRTTRRCSTTRPAIVLLRGRQSARVFFTAHGEQSIGFDAMEWAAPFVNDETVGAEPTIVDVLTPATSCGSAAMPRAIGGSRRSPRCRARSRPSILRTARSSRSRAGSIST